MVRSSRFALWRDGWLTVWLMLDYDAFAEALRAIDKRDDVLVTIWQGMCGVVGSCSLSRRADHVLQLLAGSSARKHAS